MSETAHSWPMLASEGIRSAAGRRGDKIAIRQYTGDALMGTIDYRSLVDMMNRVSNAVRHHWGLKRGDHVAIVAANSIDFIALTCGMGAVGMVIAKPNPKLSIAEICAICDDACAKLIFCEAAIAQRVRSAEPQLADRVVDIDNELGPVLHDAGGGGGHPIGLHPQASHHQCGDGRGPPQHPDSAGHVHGACEGQWPK